MTPSKLKSYPEKLGPPESPLDLADEGANLPEIAGCRWRPAKAPSLPTASSTFGSRPD
jgi:hypothetical protein